MPRRTTIAACLVLALAAGPAAAQAPAEPIKPALPTPPAAGGTPDKIPFGQPYGAPIGLDQAKAILGVAEAEAAKHGWPMNIAVVDTHGDLVHFVRMDNSQLASVGISQRKARTAARFRRESRVFYNGYATGATYFATLDPDLAASPGGIPLVVDGKIIGAIGCSGGTGDQDALICGTGAASLK